MNRSIISRFLLPVVILAVLVGATFSPEVRPTLVRAFGETPFGLPVTFVVAVAQLILFLPLLWALHHLVLIAERARKDSRFTGQFGLLVYLFGVGQRHTDLRRSQMACLFGLLYFAAICAGLIYYAAKLGI